MLTIRTKFIEFAPGPLKLFQSMCKMKRELAYLHALLMNKCIWRMLIRRSFSLKAYGTLQPSAP